MSTPASDNEKQIAHVQKVLGTPEEEDQGGVRYAAYASRIRVSIETR